MEELFRLLNSVDWERVTVTLLDSLWQGGALAAIVWASLRCIPATWARLRYGVALAGLLGVVIAAMATFHLLGDGSARASRETFVTRAAVPEGQPRSFASPPVDRSNVISTPNPYGAGQVGPVRPWAWAASVWLAGTFVMLIRAGWLVMGAGNLLRGCRFIDDPRPREALEQLRQSMGILRRARLATGPAIRVPAVLGMFVPVVLLPVAAVNEMPLAHLRMILAHELAHVRRHDYLVNLLQLLVESLLFFNPAVWWLSREVRLEREACCDALAVKTTGDGPEYVRSLAAVMAGLVSAAGGQPGLRLTPALTGEGGIVDRVKRVLFPGHRPQVRLPWYSLIGMTIIAVVLLAGMWRGTQVAVQAAEELMTPAQRVEKMAELQKELVGAVNVPAELSVLTGTVRTEDGQPLPANMQAMVETRSGRSTASCSLTVDKQGHFSRKLQGRLAQVWAAAPGYAPAISEPLRTGSDGNFASVELVLAKGFDATLQLTDRAGKPVPNARATIAYRRDFDIYNFFGAGEYVSSADGTIIVRHAADYPAQLTVDLHGYEYDVLPVRLQPNTDTTARLTVAKPTSGVVTDATSHKPLAGATVALVQRDGFQDMTWSPRSPSGSEMPVLARTDDQGHFTLDTLREDSTYVLWVTAADHGAQLVQGVRAARQGLDWALGKSRAITLEIRAEAGRMPKTVGVVNPLRLGNNSYNYGFGLPVSVKDGIGTAVLADPIPGTVEFEAGGRQLRVDTDTVEGPVLMDLRSEVKPPAMREVVLKFVWPKDGAEPHGKVRVDYLKPENPGSYWPEEVDVKNGESRVSVPVPTKFGYSQGELAGYWIDDRHDIAVPAGNEPLVITVPADPAGAIHGTVVDENGKPFTQYFYVSLVPDKATATAYRRASTIQPFNSNPGSGKYLFSPVPLDGTYQLIAVAGARFAVTEQITVDADHPIRSVGLEFTAGVMCSGTVLGPQGEPMSGIRIRLECQLPNYRAGIDATTDRQGKFAFEHVEPRAGDYSLSVRPGVNTQGLEMKQLVVGDEPMEIRLKPGLTAQGRVLDVETGKGMANVKVVLTPKDARHAQYADQVDALTNLAGEFEARGLEAIEYSVTVPDTYEPNATILRDADGKPTGVQENQMADRPAIKGGQEGVLEIKRLRSPWK